ncbi:MAG: signal peptide peptidase SppA [Planctomycetaceae bacterium]|nr:MAG: signal peptide peptidase SppA [Planctomycetaceae bacterium]
MTQDNTSGVQFPPVNSGTGTPPVRVQQVYVTPKHGGFLRRFFMTLFVLMFLLSIVINAYLLLILAAGMESPMAKKTLQEGNEDQVVAVYSVSGIIDGSAVEKFNQFYRDVVDDASVKAIVLRVESPGGGVTASDEIYATINKLKDKGNKTIVVSMGAVAASGGYYISAPADEIFAEPTTITGSIGVIMEWFIVRDGLNKLGVEPVVMKSSHAQEWKDELSFLDKPTELQRQHLQMILNTMQARFEKVVSEGRGTKIKLAAATMPVGTQPADTAPFNGKIYLADEAKALGLIDTIGYEDAAIDQAGKLAKLTRPKVVQYERRVGFLDRLAGAKPNAGINIDSKTIDDLQTPRTMMLWKGQ